MPNLAPLMLCPTMMMTMPTMSGSTSTRCVNLYAASACTRCAACRTPVSVVRPFVASLTLLLRLRHISVVVSGSRKSTKSCRKMAISSYHVAS